MKAKDKIKIKISHLPDSITKMKWIAYIDFDFGVKNGYGEVGGSGASGETVEQAVEKLISSSTVKRYFKEVEEKVNEAKKTETGGGAGEVGDEAEVLGENS